MRSRRISKLALALTAGVMSALVIFPNVAQSDVAAILDPNEGWTVPSDMQTAGSMGARFMENSNIGSQLGLSYLTQSQKGPGSSETDPTCSSTDDTKCDLTDYGFVATLPTCASITDVNCLAEVGAIDANGTKIPGTFSRYLPDKAQNEYKGNPDWNLPSGTGASLYTIPGVNSPAGDTYVIGANMSGHGQHSPNKNSIVLENFSASIVPVQILNIPDLFSATGCPLTPRVCNPGLIRFPKPDGSAKYILTGGTGSDGKYSCAAVSFGENLCAQKQAFPNNYRFYMKLRLTLMPSGWLHGRISEPNISITTVGKVSELTVTAAPIKVPIVFKRYIWDQMPAELRALYNADNGQYIGGGWSGSYRLLNDKDVSNPMLRAMLSSPPSSATNGIKELTAWLPFVEDKAIAMPSYWSVRSLTGDELRTANACFTNPNQVNGIVTTNSTQYSAGPPEFDKDEQSLNYKVASPHFTSAGDVFKGSYDLAMRSDVARCVYGFSKAPVRATVSIVSSNGTPQVATTVFNEKDGWVYLSAKNFEYSAPSVRVKLEQDAPAPAATVDTKPAATVESKPVAAAKSATITCIKGKLTKKVTGTNPKCPAGYKKK